MCFQAKWRLWPNLCHNTVSATHLQTQFFLLGMSILVNIHPGNGISSLHLTLFWQQYQHLGKYFVQGHPSEFNNPLTALPAQLMHGQVLLYVYAAMN